jgi:hypothetical protein
VKLVQSSENIDSDATLQRPFRVSVVIPTLNEAANLPLVLPYIPMEYVDEVILVDGRSTDNTVEAAQSLMPTIKVVHEKKPGKGAALQAGYQASSGDIIIVMDADGSNDPREIPRFIRALLEGADLVKGSRFADSGGTTDMPRYRRWGNQALVWMANMLFGCTFSDLCYGYHAFWRHCLEIIQPLQADGFEIDTAIYLRAVRERLRVVDIPSFEGYRFHGEGKLQTFPDGWRVLRTIVSQWLDELRGQGKKFYPGFRTNPYPSTSSHFLESQVENTAQLYELFRTGELNELESLYTRLDSDLQTAQHYNHLVQHILQTSLAHAKARSASLVLFNNTNGAVNGYSYYQGDINPIEETRLSLALERGLAGWVVYNRAPALVNSTKEDPRWLLQPWEQAENVSRSALGVPLVVSDSVFGVMILSREADYQFTESDLQFLCQNVSTVSSDIQPFN